MAKLILKDCSITVNGVDLSDHASSVEIEATKDDVETTSFDGSGKETGSFVIPGVAILTGAICVE